jgi:nucleoside-diphosphate-sugar epimerase
MKRTIVLAGVDGYIGNALVQRLLFKGHKVVGVDNFLRRRWVREYMNSFSATPIMGAEERTKLFQKLGDYSFEAFDIAADMPFVQQVIGKYQPDTVINLAHIPSGPFSQLSYETADLTLKNNYIGTNNMLWAIRELCPSAHYITIGTTGEYDHYSNIDIEEGYIKINHNGRESSEMIYPRRPGSIYHSSKTASTYLIDFLARTWGLKCTDVQQSVVFGAYTDEIDQTKIYSRLDSDEAAGTVINRFVVQAVLGVPLTVYGKGKHQRGFLSLNDSVQALELAVENPPEEGSTQVWNQLSEWHSMNALADMVKEVCQDVEINHIPTPRSEYTGEHYYKYITQKLAKLGYKPTRTIEQEIKYVYDVLNESKEDLFPLEAVVMPKITWK